MRLAELPVRSLRAGLNALEGAEAVFLTNTRYGIRPVGEIAPMGWRYARSNAIVRKLAQRLTRDRAAQTARFRRDWA